MLWLITGLGNPGPEYVNTRHNIGFRVVETWAARLGTSFVGDRHGHTAGASYRGQKLVLLKPNTYMNASGKAVRYHLQAHRTQPSQCLVVTDDVALPYGTLRLRPKGSAGGHNGLADIEQTLGTQDYPRLRVGIGADYNRGAQVDYVLGDFTAAEQDHLPLVLAAAADALEAVLFQGLEQAMTRYNRSVLPKTES